MRQDQLRRFLAACLVSWIPWLVPVRGQVLFRQNFDRSPILADYVNPAPDAGQFNALGWEHGVGAAILDPDYDTGLALVFARTNGTGTGWFARTTDLGPAPLVLKAQFALGVTAVGDYQTDVAVLQVGSGFGPSGERESDAYAQLALDFLSPDLSLFGFTGAPQRYFGDRSGGFLRCTWVLNHSGTAIGYANPTNGISMLSHDRFDFWVQIGDLNYTTKNFDNVPALNSAAALTNLKFVFDKGAGVIGLDNLVLTSVPVPPSAPRILVQPTGQTMNEGDTVEFTVECTGFPPPSYQWRFNGLDLPGATAATLTLENLATNQAGNYAVTASNYLGRTVSTEAALRVIPLLTLGQAVDAPELVWSNGGGDAPWLAQTNVTHDGVAAAQSGRVFAGQRARLDTVITGPGNLSFWWRMSPGRSSDVLFFVVNDVVWTNLQGDTGWQKQVFEVPAGEQRLRWSYAKGPSWSGSPNNGSDAAWIDQVQLTRLELLRPAMLTDRSFQFTIAARPAGMVQIEASTNLTHWIPLPQGTNGSEAFTFKDAGSADRPQRYYRALLGR